LYQNSQLDEAENLAVSLTEILPNHPFPLKILGVIFKQTGRIAQAVSAMQKSTELAPHDAEAHSNLGIMLRDIGKLDEAEASLKQAIALNPEFAEAHSNLGNTLKELGKLNKAEACYLKAIELKPHFVEAYYNLGIILKEQGRLEEAKKKFRQAINLAPEYTEAHSELGITFKELGRMDKAEVSFTQAIALMPSFAEAHCNLGIALKELGRFNQAEARYREAIALKPDFAEAHYSLANTLQELGKLDEAETSYKQAISLKSDYAEAHCNLGIMLKELGRFDEAQASFAQAIALRPSFDEAHYNLGVLFFVGREYDLAAEQFELSDTYESKLYAIQCSYHQDEKTVFYKKFDLLESQSQTNAVLGSLGFRSGSKYGVKKHNSFCNDPLKYVLKTNLNELYDFENTFIDTAKDVLKSNSVSYKMQGHLTNGVQTAGNIFMQGKFPDSEIESIIHAEIERYRIQFKDSEEGFIKNWPAAYEIKGWLVRMKSGGKLAPHMHDTGWITGSIYINTPARKNANAGNLALCLSDQEYISGIDDSRQNIIDVTTGDLCLFPSSLHHYTIPFEENEDRIVLAFDVIPKTDAPRR